MASKSINLTLLRTGGMKEESKTEKGRQRGEG